jgi:DinB superfamily
MDSPRPHRHTSKVGAQRLAHSEIDLWRIDMHPRTTELMAHLETCRHTLDAAVERVPDEARARRPTPDRWSTNEVLEHLGTVESRIASALKQRIETAIANGLGREADASPILDRIDTRRVTDRGRRIQTPPSGTPGQGLGYADAVTALDLARAATLDVLGMCDGYAIGNVRFDHPAFGALDGWEWFAFVGAHQVRHAAQIDEIAEGLDVGRA